MRRLSRGRVFYGWWIVAASFVIQFLTSGLLNQSYGSYVVLLRSDFGWSKTALSGAYSLQQLQQGLLGPIQGRIIDRSGPRTMIRLGIICLGLGFILLSQVHSLLGFYGAYFVMAMGSTLSGMFPLGVVVINWFEKRRAKAISTVSIGFALGGVVLPIIAYSLDHLGWRHTALISGIVIMAVGLPVSQVLRHRPELYGEHVDGVAPDPTLTAHPQATVTGGRRDFTFNEAIRTRAFWLIGFGHASALLVVSAVNVHVVSHLKGDLGYSLQSASLVVLLMTVMQLLGMVIGGMLGDKTDNSSLATICMGMHMTGLLLVAFAVNVPMVIGFALLHGLAWGLRGPLMTAIRADYFGRSSYGAIMGFSQFIIMFGLISGPLIAGFLADTTGSYKLGFTILGIMAGMGSIFFILAKKPERPMIEDHPSGGITSAAAPT
jgi:MFS family permease